MRTCITALAITILLPIVCAAGQTAPAEQPPGLNRRHDVTLLELKARGRGRVMRADTDHDGRISLAEWTAWRQTHPGSNPARAARRFHRLDANSDGFLTADEINAMLARRFARLDGNHDGVVSPEERAPMRPHRSGSR